MADEDQADAETAPAAAGGETGLQGGYGGDTGFASDQGQAASGQVSGRGGSDAQFGEGDSAVSGSETTAGDGQGGSASGAEPSTSGDEVSPRRSATGVSTDVTDSASGVLGDGDQAGNHRP